MFSFIFVNIVATKKIVTILCVFQDKIQNSPSLNAPQNASGFIIKTNKFYGYYLSVNIL